MGLRLSLVSFIVVPLFASSLTEIDIAIARGQFEQALRMLPAIPSIEKNEKWTRTLEKAAHGYLLQKGRVFETSRQLTRQFPQLTRNENFQEERNEAVAREFRDCSKKVKDSTECRRYLKTQLATEPENIRLIRRVGLELRSLPKALLEIYSGVMNFSNRTELCQAQELQDALFWSLERKVARELLEKDCWDVLEKTNELRMQREIASPKNKPIMCSIAKKKHSDSLVKSCREQIPSDDTTNGGDLR